MLKGKLDGSYISQNGNKTYRYVVSGTPAELEAYEKAQGDFFRKNEKGQPLFFTTDPSAGFSIDLTITQKGGIVVDTTELDVLKAIAEKGDASVKDAVAQLLIEKMTAGRGNGSRVSAPEKVDAPSADELGDM